MEGVTDRYGFPIEVRPAGLYLPALDLWLDPSRPVARAFVSHAHGDHAAAEVARVSALFASPETLALIEPRRGRPTGARPIGWNESIELPVDAAFGGGTARLSVAPAGHILGAAQLVLDHPRGRLVYTGDYRSGPGATHATGAPIACDELVIESTFGLPIFRWPAREATLDAIVAFCRACLDAGETPVLLGYALGKAQSLVRLCLDAGLPVVAHGAVVRVCAVYEALGVAMGVKDGALLPYAQWIEAGRKRTPAVLVTPPWTAGQPMVRKLKGARVALVSGWAMIDAAIERRRADAAFALSDHADHDDLLATVRATGARRVHVTHGDDVEVFARIVAERASVAAIPLPAAPIDFEEAEETEPASPSERAP
jgi:putative mRNA 3-end processing factor